jgi:outer membrane protein
MDPESVRVKGKRSDAAEPRSPMQPTRSFFAALALTTCLAPSLASAQQPLSEFITGSDSASIDLRTAQAALDTSRAQIDEARARLLPSFVASGLYQHNQSQVQLSLACFDVMYHPPNVPCMNPGPPANIQLFDVFTGTFQLNVPLIDIQGWSVFFASEQTADAAEARQAGTVQDVHATVVQLWYQLVAAHAVRDSAQHNYDAVVASRDNVQARFDAQVAPQLELSRAEAEVLRAQQTIAEADLAVVLAERSIELVTGIHPSTAPASLDDDLHEEPPLEEFMSRSHDAPIVRAAAHATRSAEMAVDAAWEGLLPTLTGAAREFATNSSGFTPSTQWALVFTATWTLDFLRPAQIGTRSDQLATARAAQDLAVQQAETRVFEQWHRVQSLRARAAAARGALAALQRADDDAHARYEAGAATQLEVIQADRDLLQSQVASIQADADLGTARHTLRIRAGMQDGE